MNLNHSKVFVEANGADVGGFYSRIYAENKPNALYKKVLTPNPNAATDRYIHFRRDIKQLMV